MERSDLSKARRCACGNVRRTTRAITQFYDNHLKPSDLHVTQFSLLLNIFLNDKITVGELGELLLMDQTTVTRNLEVLKRFGYVVITKEDSDARKKLLSITEKGLDKLTIAMPLWETAQAHIENGVGKERFRELLKILSEISSLTK